MESGLVDNTRDIWRFSPVSGYLNILTANIQTFPSRYVIKQPWVSEYPDILLPGTSRGQRERNDGLPRISPRHKKKSLTIQHVDHYARWVRVARDAGVISAVGQSGLCHQ